MSQKKVESFLNHDKKKHISCYFGTLNWTKSTILIKILILDQKYNVSNEPNKHYGKMLRTEYLPWKCFTTAIISIKCIKLLQNVTWCKITPSGIILNNRKQKQTKEIDFCYQIQFNSNTFLTEFLLTNSQGGWKNTSWGSKLLFQQILIKL